MTLRAAEQRGIMRKLLDSLRSLEEYCSSVVENLPFKKVRVTVRRKNIDITPALQAYIELKMLKPVRRLVEKVALQALPILDLELGRSTRHHRKGKVYHAEAGLSLDGTLLRAEADDEDIRTAIDLLEEELEREIVTYRGRARARERRGERVAKKELCLDPAARLYRGGRIRNEGN